MRVLILIIIILTLAMFLLSLIGCQNNQPPIPDNQPPVAEQMIVNPFTIKAGSQANITVIATDADGDVLAYYWSVTRGKVPTGNAGESIIYEAPSVSGIDVITVNITDGKASTSKEIRVSVVEETVIENIPPTYIPIPSLTLTATFIPLPTITPLPLPTATSTLVPVETLIIKNLTRIPPVATFAPTISNIQITIFPRPKESPTPFTPSP